MTLLIDWEGGGKQYQYLRKTFRRKKSPRESVICERMDSW